MNGRGIHLGDAAVASLAESFARLYDEPQGQFRLEVVLDDLLESIAPLRSGTTRVLDAGGGVGAVAIPLARLGNAVTLADPSEAMLAKAASAVAAAGLG